LQTDDYTLAILPLGHLMNENDTGIPCCEWAPGEQEAYSKVIHAGLLGYRLYTYHALVRKYFGGDTVQRVRDHHLEMLGHIHELRSLLAIIDEAAEIGAVTTQTELGEVTSSVEMNVALALLLGYPESPHYVTRPKQRSVQITRMTPEIDWHFADCLACAGREIRSHFSRLADSDFPTEKRGSSNKTH
jgi:hypothetical protein